MNVDDMAALMGLLDTDGDGTVTKVEFGAYYRRLKDCSDSEFDRVWSELDSDGDGVLTLKELCAYYCIDAGEATSAIESQKQMSDDKLLEALQLQAIVNEARVAEERQRKMHAERLRKLAELADEMEEEDDEISSPKTVAASSRAVAAAESSPTLTLMDLVKESEDARARRMGKR